MEVTHGAVSSGAFNKSDLKRSTQRLLVHTRCLPSSVSRVTPHAASRSGPVQSGGHRRIVLAWCSNRPRRTARPFRPAPRGDKTGHGSNGPRHRRGGLHRLVAGARAASARRPRPRSSTTSPRATGKPAGSRGQRRDFTRAASSTKRSCDALPSGCEVIFHQAAHPVGAAVAAAPRCPATRPTPPAPCGCWRRPARWGCAGWSTPARRRPTATRRCCPRSRPWRRCRCRPTPSRS